MLWWVAFANEMALWFVIWIEHQLNLNLGGYVSVYC